MGSPVQVVPILRAGLIPLDLAHTVLPAMVTYHVGLCRDEETLQVIAYVMCFASFPFVSSVQRP